VKKVLAWGNLIKAIDAEKIPSTSDSWEIMIVFNLPMMFYLFLLGGKK
jgi:hypothetical protein